MCVCAHVHTGAALCTVWSISGETANVSAPWLISFNYSSWTGRAQQQPGDSSICVPSALSRATRRITRLPFSECDTPPSTKALRYHTIRTLLMRSRSSFQMVSYSLQTAQVKSVIIHKEKEAFMANIWSLWDDKLQTHLTGKECFGVFIYFFGASTVIFLMNMKWPISPTSLPLPLPQQIN